MIPNTRKNTISLFSVPGFVFIFLALLFLCGCAMEGQSSLPGTLLSQLAKDKPVAVSIIYDESTGDITQLGNRFRDDIEIALKKRGYDVKPRKDLVTIIDDAEITGDMNAERNIWKKAGAGYVVNGSYTVLWDDITDHTVKVRITTKAFAVADTALADGDTTVVTMKAPEVQALSEKVLGNHFQNQFKSLGSQDASKANTPRLTVRMDRFNRCYRPGQRATLHVRTEKGIYLYIFCLSCDGNVILIYPNRYQDNQPLTTGRFTSLPKTVPLLVFVWPVWRTKTPAGKPLKFWPPAQNWIFHSCLFM